MSRSWQVRTPLNPAPLYQKTDHWFQRASAALLGEVPCRLGCTSCCIGPFPITLLDIHTLQQGLRRTPGGSPQSHRTACHRTDCRNGDRLPTTDPDRSTRQLVRSGHRPVGHSVSPSALPGAGNRRALWRLPSPPPGLPIDGHPDRRSRSGPWRLRSPNLHPDPVGSPPHSERKKIAWRRKKPPRWTRFVWPPDRQEKKYSYPTGSYTATGTREKRDR